MGAETRTARRLPDWLPEGVRLYLSHTEEGLSLRALARREGCHASTVLRHVRRFEGRRDDPLFDEALAALGRREVAERPSPHCEDDLRMTVSARHHDIATDETLIASEARRVLRRLAEAGAVLVISADMAQAAVLKHGEGPQPVRIAVLDRGVARAFALKDWITCERQGRVSTYVLTSVGRATLKRLIATQSQSAPESDPFAEQHRLHDAPDGGTGPRYNLAESPVAALSRRKDREGTPFLKPELVSAAERLREDFEIAQMGPRVAQNWDRFLTSGDRGGFGSGGGPAEGPRAARDRVQAALTDLGPGLGDVALRCCCYLEGLETTEKSMGWSARSGKIVLRIALQRLRRHYDARDGGRAPMIG